MDDQTASALGVPTLASHVSKIRADLPASDKALLGHLGIEDVEAEFSNMLDVAGGPGEGSKRLVTPSYLPVNLSRISQQNNTMLQCIAAMETNIDGTGHDIVRRDGNAMTDADTAEASSMTGFFDSVYPGVSLLTLRRAVRRDVESTGNGYIEVVPDSGGNIGFLRRLDANLMYLVSLGNPVMVTRTVSRGGVEVEGRVIVRERRFCMVAGTRKVFYREFGSTCELNLETGDWETEDKPVPDDRKASQVLHLTAIPDVTTNYGVPRWINNIPAVLGSRKAEEVNLAYFDSGGVPPIIIMIKGGQMTQESRKALTDFLAAPTKIKQRGVVVELYSTTGSIDKESEVKVDVERFGSERQDDALFMKYDAASAEHVRMAFRLPPLFLGQPADYNRATAVVSYMVAEAQVFKPERDEFDGMFNSTVVAAMSDKYVIKSKPVTLFSTEDRLKALELVVNAVDQESLVDAVNDMLGLELDRPRSPGAEGGDAEVAKMGGEFARHVITGEGDAEPIRLAVSKMTPEEKARFAASMGVGLLEDIAANPPTGADFLLLADEAA